MSTQIKILAIALACSLALCLWQRAEIADLKSEIAGIETALTKAHVNTLTANLSATTQILQERDTAFASIHQSETWAAISIATATAAPEESCAVNPDGFLPRALSDALLVQSTRVRAGSGGDSPAGLPVHP